MAALRSIFFVLLGVLCVASPTSAAALSDNGFASWIQQMEQEAIDNGISTETVHAALDHAVLDDRTVELDQKQPETAIAFDTYNQRILTSDRIAEGHRLLQKHAALLENVAGRYGVPPQIIVALWGMESNFGRHAGDYSIVDSLVTLAYEGRRGDFFRRELINALRIIEQEHMPVSALRGSWAGAMGQCQFMPSTYLHYAVDYNDNGRSDIWHNPADIFASIAHYLAAEGWKPELTWGREVQVPENFSPTEAGLDRQHDLETWGGMGVLNLDGTALPQKPLQASLLQPDGPEGRSFLVYENVRALMRWNKSTYFAITVGMLADRIR